MLKGAQKLSVSLLDGLEKLSVSLRNGLEKTSVSLRNTNYYRAWPYYGDLLTLSQAHYGD